MLPALRCGVLAHGFTRVRCGDCGQEHLLTCSCAFRRRGLLAEDAATDMLSWQGTGGFSFGAARG